MRTLQCTEARPVLGLQFSPDGRALYSATQGGFDSWDLEAGHSRFVKWTRSESIYAFHMDPVGRRLYAAGQRNGARFYEMPDGVENRYPGDSDHILSLDVSADGSVLAMCRGPVWSNGIECWDVAADGAFTRRWTVSCSSQGSMAYRLALSLPSNRLVAVESHSPAARTEDLYLRQIVAGRVLVLRSIATGEEIEVLGDVPGEQMHDVDLAFLGDGNRFLAWYPEFIDFWDISAGEPIARARPPGRSRFWGLAVSPASHVIATASGDGSVQFRDTEALREIKRWKWGIGKLQSVAFSPDGALAAVGSDRGKIVVWDVDV